MRSNLIELMDWEARADLHDDKGLIAVQEAHLIATGQVDWWPARTTENTVTSTVLLGCSDWEVALLRAPNVEIIMVGVAALGGLALSWSSGYSLFQGVYSAHPLAAALVGGLGVLLLALLPLRALYGRCGSYGEESLKTAASSIMGAALVEYAVIHWPSDSAPATLHLFVFGNAIVLMLAFIFVMVRVRQICSRV